LQSTGAGPVLRDAERSERADLAEKLQQQRHFFLRFLSIQSALRSAVPSRTPAS